MNISNISPSDSGVYTIQASTLNKLIKTTIKISVKSNLKYFKILVPEINLIFTFKIDLNLNLKA